MLDQILEKLGRDYDELEPEERISLHSIVEAAEKKQITPERMKVAISKMREAVQLALIDEPEFNYIFIFKVPNRKQIYLKARMRNYLMIESLFVDSELAKKSIEEAVARIKQI